MLPALVIRGCSQRTLCLLLLCTLHFHYQIIIGLIMFLTTDLETGFGGSGSNETTVDKF